MTIYYVFNIPSQKNATSLRLSLGFHDVRSCFTFFYTLVVVSELTKLRRDGPSLRKKVVLFWKVLAHGHET